MSSKKSLPKKKPGSLKPISSAVKSRSVARTVTTGGLSISAGIARPARKFGTLAEDAKSARKFGTLAESVKSQGTSSGHPSCYARCKGEVIAGMWIHTRGCPYTVVLWRAHGFTLTDWECVYGCQATALSSGWTHDYRCPFWNATGETPIGLRAPMQ